MKIFNKICVIALLLGVFMSGRAVNANGLLADTTAPTVNSTNPASDAIDVAINQKIAVTFSEAMKASTITNNTFLLKRGTKSVFGKVTYVGVTAIFTPSKNLKPNTKYTATIKNTVKDRAGNKLASKFVWKFTTGAAKDTTAPTVSSTIPENAATGAAINMVVNATFSEEMDPSTITKSTFKLKQGIVSISGKVSYAGVTAKFTPSSDLEPNTVYTATITTKTKDLAGNKLASNYVWSFTTGVALDSSAPTVSSTVPANAATGVAVNSKISANFSEAMDPLTVKTTTFTLKKGSMSVSGVVSYSGVIGVFTPISDLTTSTVYTATITTETKDLAGNAIASNYVWSFTTGAEQDTTAPTVTLTVPANSATGVAINSKMSATFSEAMDPLTVTTANFTVSGPGDTPITGVVVLAATTNIATFRPTGNLAASTVYTATITSIAKDLAGNAMTSDYVWNFTTGAAPDTTAPTVSSTIPSNDDTGVLLNIAISATFSEAMDPLTVTTANFTVAGPGETSVTGTVMLGEATNIATFTPSSNLAASTVYTATITTVAKDLAGNAMASDYVWSFTTGAVTGILPVDLGLAGNYAILAKSGVSTTGSTLVTGNIGVSPIDSTAITGFGLILDASTQFATSSLVVGNVYASDYAVPTPANLTTAVSNMETAYTDAAGRTLPDATELGAGEIGGMTIAPGLYKWSSGVLITTDVTLNGGPNDVWIFQIAENLTVANGMSVILSGGAQAKNIFWQVAGGVGVEIGTTAHMEGIILAQNAITLNTGATWTGRALAQKAVTLDANAITKPD